MNKMNRIISSLAAMGVTATIVGAPDMHAATNLTPPAITKANMERLKKGEYVKGDHVMKIGGRYGDIKTLFLNTLHFQSNREQTRSGYQEFEGARLYYSADSLHAKTNDLRLKEMAFTYPERKYRFTKHKKAFGRETASVQTDGNAITKRYGKLNVTLKKSGGAWYVSRVSR